MENFKVSIVIPTHNEEGNITILAQGLQQVLSKYAEYEIIFIDDGSKDASLSIIKSLANINSHIKFLSFSRNFGHQNALIAGLDFSSGDCVISMDGDMQHPPEIIDEMIEKWKSGYDVVYTIRKKEESISFFKKITSKLFYKLVNIFSDVEIVEGAADFRLMDKKVVDVFKNNIHEYYLFIRGLVSWVGFRQFAIYYTPNKRLHGKTKYSLRKMISFAANGLTSFSVKPLRIAIYFGFFISLLSFIYGIYAVIMSIYSDKAVVGWGSVIISVLFIGGVQMFLIGLLGEYLGKLFFESKRRPRYIIKESNL